MRIALKLGCHCTPELRHGWYARCNECGYRFKITQLMPAFDGTLVSRTCRKPGATGSVTRVPEEVLMAHNGI